jgi:hypothetical protein
MSSFHGMWSFAGFTGALMAWELALSFLPTITLACRCIVILMMGFNYKYLIKAKRYLKPKRKIIFKTR